MTEQDEIFIKAVENWCRPLWINEAGWHCSCVNNRHGLSERSSKITEQTAANRMPNVN